MALRIGMKSFLPQSSLSSTTTSWDGYGILELTSSGPPSSWSPSSGAGTYTSSSGLPSGWTRRRAGGVPTVTSPGRSVSSPTFTRTRVPFSPTIPSSPGGRRRISPVPLPSGSPPQRYTSELGPRVGGYRAIRPPVRPYRRMPTGARPYRRMPTGVRPPSPLVLGPTPGVSSAYRAPAPTVGVPSSPQLARLRQLLSQGRSQGFRSWVVQGQRGRYRGQWVNRISRPPYPPQGRKSPLTKAINKERRRLVKAGLRPHVRAMVRQFFGEPQKVVSGSGRGSGPMSGYWGNVGNTGIGPGMF